MYKSNSYTYEEIEEIFKAKYKNKDNSEISKLLDGARTTGAINTLLNNFYVWYANNGEAAYISKIVQEHFTRYIKDHPNQIPLRKSVEETEEESAEETQEETESTEVEEQPTEGIDWDVLKKWYAEGSKIIPALVQAEITKGVKKIEQERDELKEKVEKQEEELNRLRPIEESYKAIKAALV